MRLLIVLATLGLTAMVIACDGQADAGPVNPVGPTPAQQSIQTERPTRASNAPGDGDTGVPAGQVQVKGATFICRDLELAFQTMAMLGYENQVLHVANEMNAQTGATPYISAGDAERALQACGGQTSGNQPQTNPRTHASAPIVAPTPNIAATKRAIDAADQRRREAELQTRVATDAKRETDRYAAELEATRTTELAIQEATRVAETEMAQAARAAEIDALCQQWEPMVRAWIKEGNYYHPSNPATPFLPDLSVQLADANCDIGFPQGLLAHTGGRGVKVGTGAGQLLPGTYRYQSPDGGNRVEYFRCKVMLNQNEANQTLIEMVERQPFEITFDTRHNLVSVINWNYGGCSGALRLVSD